jgi:hypothetical protein
MEGRDIGLTEVFSLHLPPEIEKNYEELIVWHSKLRSSEYAISIHRSFLSPITIITTKASKTKNTEIIRHKLKSYHFAGLDRPLGLQVVEARRISRQSAHEGGTVVSPTHQPPLLLGYIPGTHSCQKLGQRQGYSVAGRNKTMRNSTDPFGGW